MSTTENSFVGAKLGLKSEHTDRKLWEIPTVRDSHGGNPTGSRCVELKRLQNSESG